MILALNPRRYGRSDGKLQEREGPALAVSGQKGDCALPGICICIRRGNYRIPGPKRLRAGGISCSIRKRNFQVHIDFSF